MDLEKCTGCGECAAINLESSPKEKDGRLWVDRIIVDEALCIHCGECVKACTKENPDANALTNIVQKRILEIKKEKKVEEPHLLQKIIGMTVQERKDFWDKQFMKCIRCYGCIDVCPVRTEEPEELSLSKWIKRAEVPPKYPAFHLLRAYHVWDTCILCGECEATCPSGIPLKTLQDITQFFSPEDVFELVPGLDKEIKDEILRFVDAKRTQFRRATYGL